MTTTDLNTAYRRLRDRGVLRLLELARDEDLGPHGRDLASEALAPSGACYLLRAREPGILAGLAALPDLITVYRADVRATPSAHDADLVAAGDTVARLDGHPADILRLERPLLNLVSRLSGIATLTATFVREVAGTPARLYDTRKTTPGLRALEKYAVLCGGGHSHRLGLDDAAMFKDNHLAGLPLDRLAASLTEAARRAKAAGAAFVAVETDTLDQFDQVLTIPSGLIDVILLDNMTPADLRAAVERRAVARVPVALEASGGITLGTVRAIAETGVDRLSVGAITHSALPLDFGLDEDSPA